MWIMMLLSEFFVWVLALGRWHTGSNAHPSGVWWWMNKECSKVLVVVSALYSVL